MMHTNLKDVEKLKEKYPDKKEYIDKKIEEIGNENENYKGHQNLKEVELEEIGEKIKLYKNLEGFKKENESVKLSDLIGKGKFGNYVKVDKVVEEIKKWNKFITIFGKKNEEIWYYDDGIWKSNGREIIQIETERLLQKYAKTNVVMEILNKIKRQTAIDREVFDNVPKELLPLKNGIYNFKEDKLISYSPKYYFKSKINIEYNPEAKPRKWLKFVEETFYPDDIPVVQEWFGFCLYRDYFIKKGFIGVGIGDTGKSVFQNVLMKFFGINNICGLSLQKLTKENSFSKSSLYGKYVNLYDDMSSKDINDGGGFKMVTGRSPITAEYKFGDEFQFLNFAKMTFCCNKIPPIKDTDDITYYNRWLPIPFENVVEESEQDKFLVEKLTLPEELSGILNWAIEGLKRLLKNGKFSYKKSPQEIKLMMEKSSHQLADFVQECLVEEEGNKITKEEMYEFYVVWAKEKNKAIDTKDRVSKNLRRYAPFILDKRKSNERYWLNVNFNVNNDINDIYSKKQGEARHINNIYDFDVLKNKVSFPSYKILKNISNFDINLSTGNQGKQIGDILEGNEEDMDVLLIMEDEGAIEELEE
ncbi:MAG: phage/plasmid primase, P4 family [Weeksellaceae bacterium]|nr:phage/plasmid primase, P4 family [Weeksellaceae bacterium]